MTVTPYDPVPIPDNEPERRQAVLRSGLMAIEGDEYLDRLCIEMKGRFAADWAAIVVIIDGWQYVIASTGTHIGSHRRSACISSFAILDPERVFYSLDAAADPKLAGSSFVSDGLIVFYAGAPIIDDDGFAVGVCCVTNRSKRFDFPEVEQAVLSAFAARVLPGIHGVDA